MSQLPNYIELQYPLWKFEWCTRRKGYWKNNCSYSRNETELPSCLVWHKKSYNHLIYLMATSRNQTYNEHEQTVGICRSYLAPKYFTKSFCWKYGCTSTWFTAGSTSVYNNISSQTALKIACETYWDCEIMSKPLRALGPRGGELWNWKRQSRWSCLPAQLHEVKCTRVRPAA